MRPQQRQWDSQMEVAGSFKSLNFTNISWLGNIDKSLYDNNFIYIYKMILFEYWVNLYYILSEYSK